jgi:hypothetical protein
LKRRLKESGAYCESLLIKAAYFMLQVDKEDFCKDMANDPKDRSQRFQRASQATLEDPSQEYPVSELLISPFNAKGNPIALNGIEGHLPCPSAPKARL